MKKLVCGKHLLLAFMCVLCSSMSALAFNVGDYVYTKVSKYRITGSENLVANGEFTDGSTEGWMATDEVNYPLESVFAPVEDGGLQVLPGQTALTAGMHQAVRIWAGGTYVVTFKVKGTTAGFTDHDMTGAATNYINAYYNTDGALASVDNTNLLFGENGVNGGYQFDFGVEDFTEVYFAVNAPMEGNIMIDFRGLAEGLIIKDVECHAAEEVYDDRIAVNRIAYFNKYLAGGDFDGKEHYAELQECIDAVDEAIVDNADPATMVKVMENLENCWASFVEANLSNVIDLIPTTDGSANTDNNSANWMKWYSKWNKLNQAQTKAPWTWSTDRWAHKTAAANSPLQIQWQRKAYGDFNNIATLTATLTPGTYYWGVSGQGGMMTLNRLRWARSWANENAATQLFFNGDTTEVFILNAARTEDYVYRFELTKEKEITLGIICNTSTVVTDGFDVAFYNPVLYKVLGEGLSPEEEAYIDIVNDQLESFKARIEVANGYLSEANDTLPWGKELLKEGVELVQPLYDEWAAMDTTTILEDWYGNGLSLRDTIINNGTRVMLINYINKFIALNKPLTDMPGAIAFAWETLNKRIYASSSKKDEYEALIVASDNLYKEMLLSEYSEENAAALIAQKVSLEAMAEEFKAAVNATTIVDIDFGTQDNPVQIEESQDWETGMYSYYITGAKGTMTFTDVLGSYCYTLGWAHDVTDETTGEVSTVIDSVGMLRVGNSEATVVVPAAPVVEAGGILNIQFDYYYGNLSGRKAGYKVLSAEGDTICGLFCSKYSRNDDLNTFGVDYNGMINAVGSSRESNLAIAAASNKTHFDIVLDYGTKTMFCTTSSSLGTVTTEIFDLPESVPTKFVLYSNYNNADRRCWFDNLKILNISTEEAPARILGDVNSDEQHTMSDVVMQVNAVLGIAQENYNADVADMNNDGNITMADVVLVLRLVLGYNSMGVSAQRWDFTSWSAATVANLKAVNPSNTEWSDIEKAADSAPTDISKENCFWQVKASGADGITLSANGEPIKETEGLIFTNTSARSLAIAVNYPTTTLGTYNGPSYLWLGSKDKNYIVIPNVKPGTEITIGLESHKPSDARGIDLFIGRGNSGTKLLAPDGSTNPYPTTYVEQTWLVPEDATDTPNEDGTFDITIRNSNGCHLYFIDAGGEEQGEKRLNVAYLYKLAAARSAVRTAAVPVLSAGDMIAVDANRMVLPINLNNDEAYSAFQLDVVLPEGVKLVEATLTNRAKSSHAIAWNTLADGTTRVVVYAMNNATFKGSEGALLNLVLETSADLAADGMIALKGGLFTAVNGTEDSSADLNVMMRSEATGIRSIYGVVQVSGTEGAVIVESNDICVVNVYALTGQMVREVTVREGKNVIDLPEGVYIVNNQRVIVK